jgi:hypothetical protein
MPSPGGAILPSLARLTEAGVDALFPGVPLPQLVGRLIAIAFARHQSRHRLDQGIREWIAQLAERYIIELTGVSLHTRFIDRAES